ncbi:MAG: hypothetical protein WC551_08790 [Patescibacteria group bacterium]
MRDRHESLSVMMFTEHKGQPCVMLRHRLDDVVDIFTIPLIFHQRNTLEPRIDDVEIIASKEVLVENGKAVR